VAKAQTVKISISKQDIPLPTASDISHYLSCETFRFYLEILSFTILPPYKGGVFRDAFGNAFRKSVCAMKQVKDCDSCFLKGKCLYVALSQPLPPKDFKDAGKYNHAPPPYVLNPPPDNRQSFHPGDMLAFDLVLIGRAIDALPYFIYSFIEMGKMGIGRRGKDGERGKYEITGVDHISGDATNRIYDIKTETLKSFDKVNEPLPLDHEEIQSVTVKLMTPLRLKEKGNLVTNLTFPLLINRTIHRLQLLSEFYGTKGPIPVPDTLIKDAEEIITANENLHWYDWERYSSRQKDLMKFGGLKGEITFTGNLTQFMPYLRLAEVVNAGQETSFGLGRYEIME
jgi:hypothetical protein